MADPRRWLYGAGWLFLVGTAVHVFDHLRRGQGSVSEELYWVGNLALVLQVVTVTLVLTRNRWAPLVSAGAGSLLALGFFTAHWLPEWSALSDPLWEIDSLVWFSYLASTLEIVGALAVASAGLAVLRHDGLAAPRGRHGAERRWAEPSLPAAPADGGVLTDPRRRGGRRG